MNDAPVTNDEQEEPEEPANLKFLRRLVTVLTGTMIVGVVVIIGLIVMRITNPPAIVPLPASISLPDGSRATAFTRGSNWYAIVTDQDEILIFDPKTGDLRQTLKIRP
ncbi:MAG: hypothetical protein COB39_13925 [Marinosulfonomonas sp.]|nr:MAG: hypothetical protein COB39_13925 [Marinosulfonomonas sp.]